MKILIVVTRGEVGGAQIFCLKLAKKLHKLGHDVVVAFGDGNYLPTELEKEKIPFFSFKLLRRSLNPLKNLLFVIELRKYLNEHKPDVLHLNSTNALSGLLAVKISQPKPRAVFTVHGLSLTSENHKLFAPLKKITTQVFCQIASLADKIVFVSERDRQALAKQLPTRKTALVRNAGHTDSTQQLERELARRELENITHIPLASAFIFGSIGRLAYPKNYEFLINIFPKIIARLPNAKLIIIGDGPDKNKLQQLIVANKLTDKVILTGVITDANRLIKAFNIFLLPSIFEGLSLTLIEALASGLPILTSNVGGSAEAVNHDQRQLFKLNNEVEFIDKLLAMVKCPSLRDEISRQNTEFAKNFSTEKMVEEYLEIYSN